ncbi:hypothetical protein PV11_01118 [Exophiala sideris]|uniref:Uncharacterized protein n=1 Tax=Exophiala sideris TaxID=1016849 RepID=A0A0D1YRW1_9EURO|nr:hypothetical protein PV11_01118 [Exophiala sideris]
MAAMNRMLGLRTDTSIPRKYRGEPDDPHFVPDSPLIGRQTLTEQEEGDLKRICAVVLANVQHSDDTSDDPFKYLAAQIHEGEAPRHKDTDQHRKPDAVQNTDTITHVTRNDHDLHNDTATPSDASPRHTFSADDYSTPLTSAGFTPGDTARRLSDTTRRSVNSTKKPGSSLRNETIASIESRKTSTAGLHRSLEAVKPFMEAEAIRTSLRIVTTQFPPSETRSITALDNSQQQRYLGPNLNKELPPPPPPLEPHTPDEDTQLHLSRLIKNIRKKKSMATAARSLSSQSTPTLPAVTESPTATLTPRASTTSSQAKEAPPKKRFRFRLFSRDRPRDILVT